MKKIVTLYVRHGTKKYAQSLDRLRERMQKFAPEFSNDIWVIENDAFDTPSPDFTGARQLMGDNTYYEFSGWQKIIDLEKAKLNNYDLIHLCTSAFEQDYTVYLDSFSKEMLEFSCHYQVALGHYDAYPNRITVKQWHSRAWLRSCYIFLQPAALLGLSNLVTVDNNERLFSDDCTHPFLSDAIICKTYQNYLLGWLTGQIKVGNGYHSELLLNEENFSHFKTKATCIINEHMLSARLREQGHLLYDIQWLERHPSHNPYHDRLPSIAEQLAARNT